jgi:hypothetical protein
VQEGRHEGPRKDRRQAREPPHGWRGRDGSAAAGDGRARAGALAKKQPNPEFEQFAQCAVSVKKVTECLVAHTTSGEFKLGSKIVKINKAITVQGGVVKSSHALVPATNGETLSITPLTVPSAATPNRSCCT